MVFSPSAELKKGEGQNCQDFQPYAISITTLFANPSHFLAIIFLLPTNTSHTMAPSLEESTQIDFEAPLKAAPKLVAPEPGMQHPLPPFLQSSYATLTLSL